jgi:gamma-glutamylcyclotransferase (GGCT)/AIG2-like uncharacterized protein YtfP
LESKLHITNNLKEPDSEKKSENDKHLLFVYGSLLKGFKGYDNYMQSAEFICNTFVKGELRYSFSDYPAIILNDNKNEYVCGELYEVDEETLNKIRKYEGSDSFLTCYSEQSVVVKKDGKFVKAKIFAVSPFKKYFIKFFTFQVPNGDWKKFIDSKRKIPIPKPLLLLGGVIVLAGFIWEIVHYFNLDKYLM